MACPPVTDSPCIHPFVVAELACGTLPDRQKTLTYFDQLAALPTVRLADVRFMMEARGLWSKGIGLKDAQLIASCHGQRQARKSGRPTGLSAGSRNPLAFARNCPDLLNFVLSSRTRGTGLDGNERAAAVRMLVT